MSLLHKIYFNQTYIILSSTYRLSIKSSKTHRPFMSCAMRDDYETEEKKQAAADVMYQYSKFVMACIGNRVRPCDLRMHLMKEISGMPSTLKRVSCQVAPSTMGESSSSGTARLEKTDSFRAL